MRIGIGFDVHALVEGRKLILGGVEIPHVKGLLGHSDADVLVHAIMDALLGALALGDIGKHFPDTDNAYKGADSLQLLKRVENISEGLSTCISPPSRISKTPISFVEPKRFLTPLNILKL
jgi:2-C-methyl-D-erythritol 2,4-cyclodiphosphate synthase